MKGSIVIAVLESYKVVHRQLLWFAQWLPQQFPEWRLVLVDDGSVPEIQREMEKQHLPLSINQWCDFVYIAPHEKPWTQPAARNLGANLCPDSEFVFFTDIDHIITPPAVCAANAFTGDKLRFPRIVGALDELGGLLTSEKDLLNFGAHPKDIIKRDEHYNTFSIRKSIHDLMGGYDEKFCGKYGGDDTDYSRRYGELHYAGKCERSEMCEAPIYVFPDPKGDRQHLFHDLRRKGHTEWN